MDYGAVLMDTEIIEKIKFVLKDKVAISCSVKLNLNLLKTQIKTNDGSSW